jgi:mono/diheme cytochrome c family protein
MSSPRSSIFISSALAFVYLSGCLSNDSSPVPVAPSFDSFGREYPENFARAGRQLAMENCASCHAIDDVGVSPNPAAPPMNRLLSNYNADALANDLVAGVWVGHAGMPVFDFNVIAADSLIAYLETINQDYGKR